MEADWSPDDDCLGGNHVLADRSDHPLDCRRRGVVVTDKKHDLSFIEIAGGIAAGIGMTFWFMSFIAAFHFIIKYW
jgi:hypothetical protein